MNLPTEVANQSLDAIAADFQLGDIEEGTKPAQIVLRAYRQCLMQLLRAAHWDFARRTAPLVLLADMTGQTPAVGTVVPVPWTYEYEYPIDCMKARFVPWNQNQAPGPPPGNISIPSTPLMTGLGSQPLSRVTLRPARFLVATDFNYIPASAPGSINWETHGTSPQGRTVVLTNVQNAQLVYTALLNYPSVWDSLFRAAFVAYLASEVALPIWVDKDRKFGMELREQQIKIAQQKIQQARITDGNEGFPTNDISVDWMQLRSTGGGLGGWRGGGAFGGGEGPGVMGYGWDQCAFADGAVF